MINKLLLGALAVSGLMAVGCSDTFDPTGDSEGRILLSLGLDKEVAAPAKAPGKKAPAKAASRAASAKEISVNDLSLTLKAVDGSMQRAWASIADFDAAENFPAGSYEIEAFYGASSDEGFDKPYYFGNTTTRVYENQTSQVSLTARLANAMITVSYTEAVKQYFASFQGEVVTASAAVFPYAGDETRALYITPGHTEVTVDVTKQTGVSAKLSAITFNAEPCHHYYVTIDVNGGEVGAGVLNVTYNSDLVEEEIELDLSDEILSLPAPTLTAQGFVDGETISVVEGYSGSKDMRVIASAPGDIKTATLTVNSVSLKAQGWPETVDFASADAATLDKLRALGLQFAGLTGTLTKMAMIDFSNVASHIRYEEGYSNSSTFTLTVTDTHSKVSEPLTFTIDVEKVDFTIDNVLPLYIDETELALEVSYNGGDLAKEVRFESKNNLGVWKPLAVNSVEPKGRTMSSYIVKLAVPAAGEILLRAVVGDITTEVYTIPHIVPAQTLSVDENNVFAHKAKLTFIMTDGSDAVQALGQSQILVSADGADFKPMAIEADGADFTLSSLSPATNYQVKAMLGGKNSVAVSFTTESAPQLPNSDMESIEQTASGDNWERWDVTGWATYNLMTTGNTGTRNGTAYVNRSGTAPSTDAHGGQYAAELRTIGWGSGNGAYGSISSSNPKYITKGMLYLGGSPTQYDQLEAQATKGISFASRPSALKFWYKYAPYNSADFGGAVVWVIDASGKTIASGTAMNLTEKAYAQVTIPLTYAPGAGKAAKIYVEFASSYNDGWSTRSKDWFTVPNFGNLSDGKFQGSSMFVDDIELVY